MRNYASKYASRGGGGIPGMAMIDIAKMGLLVYKKFTFSSLKRSYHLLTSQIGLTIMRLTSSGKYPNG
jgi:hypothetical protein